jgi:hypothetical protein
MHFQNLLTKPNDPLMVIYKKYKPTPVIPEQPKPGSGGSYENLSRVGLQNQEGYPLFKNEQYLSMRDNPTSYQEFKRQNYIGSSTSKLPGFNESGT